MGKYDKCGAYHWDFYGKIPAYTHHVDHILGIFADKFGTSPSLLDVGCGDGLIAALLSRRGFDVVGVDADPKAISLARSKSPDIKFVCKDIFRVSTKFEYVLASEIIEHLNDDIGFLKKLNTLFFGGLLITTCTPHPKLHPGHVREYTQEQFEKVVHSVFPSADIHKHQGHFYAWVERA